MTRRLAWSVLLTATFSLAGVSAAAATPQPEPRTASLAPCPAGTGQIASHSGIEIDHGRGQATVSFAVADGCHDVEISLASYRVSRTQPDAGEAGTGQEHEQLLWDVDAGRFTAGEIHELTVVIELGCYHHVMLVLGAPVERFGPEHSFEQEQGRTIESKLDGGPDPCAAQPPRRPAAASTSTTQTGPATTAAAAPATTVPPSTQKPEPPSTTVAAAPTTAAAAAAAATTTAAAAPAIDPEATPLVVTPATRNADRLPFTGTSVAALFVTGLLLLASGLLLLARSNHGSR